MRQSSDDDKRGEEEGDEDLEELRDVFCNSLEDRDLERRLSLVEPINDTASYRRDDDGGNDEVKILFALLEDLDESKT